MTNCKRKIYYYSNVLICILMANNLSLLGAIEFFPKFQTTIWKIGTNVTKIFSSERSVFSINPLLKNLMETFTEEEAFSYKVCGSIFSETSCLKMNLHTQTCEKLLSFQVY